MELTYTKIEIPDNPIVLTFQDGSQMAIGRGILQEIVFKWATLQPNSLVIPTANTITP
jgi:hypothetical protein